MVKRLPDTERLTPVRRIEPRVALLHPSPLRRDDVVVATPSYDYCTLCQNAILRLHKAVALYVRDSPGNLPREISVAIVRMHSTILQRRELAEQVVALRSAVTALQCYTALESDIDRALGEAERILRYAVK